MDKVREVKLRNWANRLGLFLTKTRHRKWSLDDHLGYAIRDKSSNEIIYGAKYDLDLDQVEKFFEDYEQKLKAK